MPRVTVIADVDSPGERESFEAWMEKWQSRRTFTPENLDAAIAELPEMMKCADAGEFSLGSLLSARPAAERLH